MEKVHKVGDVVSLEDIAWCTPEDEASITTSLIEGVGLFVRAGLNVDLTNLKPQARLLVEEKLLVYIELSSGHEVSVPVAREQYEWRR